MEEIVFRIIGLFSIILNYFFKMYNPIELKYLLFMHSQIMILYIGHNDR